MIRVGEVRFCRNGSSGNVYAIMGGAIKILRRVGMYDKAKEMVDRVTSSGSYDDALKIIGEYVNLVEFWGEV